MAAFGEAELGTHTRLLGGAGLYICVGLSG
eukprot:SAG25_NODE_8535_length_417_cov_0.805031_1_plen_30_part_10